MIKLTVIYTESVGYNGATFVKRIFVETPSVEHKDIWAAINEAGYKHQLPGHEWDIADSVVYMFYGHQQDVL